MNVQPEYLPLKELAVYSGLSVRTLRAYLRDPAAPLPYFQPAGGKLLVKRSDFDAWMARFRKDNPGAVDQIVNDLLRKVS
jgi:excisionase family DNA binding protein